MSTTYNFSDNDPVTHVLEQIGKDRLWSKEDIHNDVKILNMNRIYRVNDLKALSSESWTQIALLPLVKDLLRSFVCSTFGKGDNKKGDSSNKKKGKKSKEGKMKDFISPSALGTPVVPTIIEPTVQEDEDISISQDHLTIQNTIINRSSGGLSTDEEAELNITVNSNSERKSVSFSDETTIGVAASEKTKDKENKKKKKKKKDDKKKDNNMASNKNSSEYLNLKNHPYNATYPIIKFRKMKMKHCKHLPPVPDNDSFLQGIHDKLTRASTP